MNRTYTLLLFLAFPSSNLFSQTLEYDWAKRMGANCCYEEGRAIAADALGNIYSAGYYSGTADFDPDTSIYNLGGHGTSDIYISKLDANGHFIWAKGIGNQYDDRATAITIDIAGNIYITGFFNSSVDFDPNPNIAHTLYSGNNSDAFVLKLDSGGNYIWAKGFGDNYFDNGNSIITDLLGNVYTTGRFGGTVDFDPGPDTFKLTSAGDNEVFISKLDSAGNFIWAEKFGGIHDDRGNSIVTDSSGNIFVTGFFMDTVDFDPGPNTYNLISAGDYDAFICKFDSSGNFIWADRLGGTGDDRAASLIRDHSGYMYLTGYFSDTTIVNLNSGTASFISSGIFDIFISKIDSSGNFLWFKTIGGTSFDEGLSMVIDHAGLIYTSCYFMQTADFDPGPLTNNLTSAGGKDVCVLVLDDAGNFVGVEQVGGTSDETGYSITADMNDDVITTGVFNSYILDFNPGPGVDTLMSHFYDVFIQKLRQPTLNIKIPNYTLTANISPNPFNRNFTINFEKEISGIVNIYSITGQIILNKKFERLINLDLFIDEAPGFYFAKIFTNDDIERNIKLIKQ